MGAFVSPDVSKATSSATVMPEVSATEEMSATSAMTSDANGRLGQKPTTPTAATAQNRLSRSARR